MNLPDWTGAINSQINAFLGWGTVATLIAVIVGVAIGAVVLRMFLRAFIG